MDKKKNLLRELSAQRKPPDGKGWMLKTRHLIKALDGLIQEYQQYLVKYPNQNGYDYTDSERMALSELRERQVNFYLFLANYYAKKFQESFYCNMCFGLVASYYVTKATKVIEAINFSSANQRPLGHVEPSPEDLEKLKIITSDLKQNLIYDCINDEEIIESFENLINNQDGKYPHTALKKIYDAAKLKQNSKLMIIISLEIGIVLHQDIVTTYGNDQLSVAIKLKQSTSKVKKAINAYTNAYGLIDELMQQAILIKPNVIHELQHRIVTLAKTIYEKHIEYESNCNTEQLDSLHLRLENTKRLLDKLQSLTHENLTNTDYYAIYKQINRKIIFYKTGVMPSESSSWNFVNQAYSATTNLIKSVSSWFSIKFMPTDTSTALTSQSDITQAIPNSLQGSASATLSSTPLKSKTETIEPAPQEKPGSKTTDFKHVANTDSPILPKPRKTKLKSQQTALDYQAMLVQAKAWLSEEDSAKHEQAIKYLNQIINGNNAKFKLKTQACIRLADYYRGKNDIDAAIRCLKRINCTKTKTPYQQLRTLQKTKEKYNDPLDTDIDNTDTAIEARVANDNAALVETSENPEENYKNNPHEINEPHENSTRVSTTHSKTSYDFRYIIDQLQSGTAPANLSMNNVLNQKPSRHVPPVKSVWQIKKTENTSISNANRDSLTKAQQITASSAHTELVREKTDQAFTKNSINDSSQTEMDATLGQENGNSTAGTTQELIHWTPWEAAHHQLAILYFNLGQQALTYAYSIHGLQQLDWMEISLYHYSQALSIFQSLGIATQSQEFYAARETFNTVSPIIECFYAIQQSTENDMLAWQQITETEMYSQCRLRL